ncbi:MAG TPA: hypothetical protein VD978_05270 [Azospirillum sp.]|nr:hypothetical protein [Azospirillum sp.]
MSDHTNTIKRILNDCISEASGAQERTLGFIQESHAMRFTIIKGLEPIFISIKQADENNIFHYLITEDGDAILALEAHKNLPRNFHIIQPAIRTRYEPIGREGSHPKIVGIVDEGGFKVQRLLQETSLMLMRSVSRGYIGQHVQDLTITFDIILRDLAECTIQKRRHTNQP